LLSAAKAAAVMHVLAEVAAILLAIIN